MSYTDPSTGGDPWTQYRKVTARKQWPCAFAKAGGDQCDGTIRPGEPYIDEAVVPWAPVYDEVGDDEYSRPQFAQVDTVGRWTHTRYHERCEATAVGDAFAAEMFGTVEEMRAEEDRQAAEFAAWEKAEQDGRTARKARQQHNSRKARRQREIAAHAGSSGATTTPGGTP